MAIYQQQHPERIAAHRLVKEALYSGRLAKPLFCQRCYRQVPIECHHPNYRKPLKVLWLCRKCHVYVHPRTQKSAKAKPTFQWEVTASSGDMAAAMRRAREEVA